MCQDPEPPSGQERPGPEEAGPGGGGPHGGLQADLQVEGERDKRELS